MAKIAICKLLILSNKLYIHFSLNTREPNADTTSKIGITDYIIDYERSPLAGYVVPQIFRDGFV